MSPSPDPVEREREEAIRDDLTVLVQRIHPHADDFEIFEFFSQAGRVRDIRLIRDQRSGKSKGVGYVEFYDLESVMKALALNGIAFKGQPLLVQASMAEKNRMAQMAKNQAAVQVTRRHRHLRHRHHHLHLTSSTSTSTSTSPPHLRLPPAQDMMGFGEAAEPTKLVVSELHTHISGSDLKEVFAPFGAVVGIEVQTANGQPDGPSIGVAVVTFEEAAHAKDAQAAINGLELAGKKIIVDFVREASAILAQFWRNSAQLFGPAPPSSRRRRRRCRRWARSRRCCRRWAPGSRWGCRRGWRARCRRCRCRGCRT